MIICDRYFERVIPASFSPTLDRVYIKNLFKKH